VYPVIAYSLLVTNILYITQFPDYRADLATGKHHWVVRLGPMRARWVYLAIVIVAYACFGVMVATGRLPIIALIAVLPIVLSFKAGLVLLANAVNPRQLEPALKMTIAAASAHGLLLTIALFVS